jgi:hypothetical protein
MKVHFSAPYPVFGRVNARLNVSYQQRSPYYWWWQYLRRNEDYLKCCERGGTGKLARLYGDFGDVRSDDFHKWWTHSDRGPKLFSEQPLTIKFGELNSAADFSAEWRKEQVAVVAFPLDKSKRQLMSDIKRLLDQRHVGRQGRPALAELQSTARYRLSRNYTIPNLQTSLDVYDLWLKSQQATTDEHKLALWEIGRELNLNPVAVRKAQSRLALDRATARNHLSALVSRYLRWAKSNVAAVASGEFPARDSVAKRDEK